MKKKMRIFGLLMTVMMFVCCLPLDVFADSFIVAGEEFNYYLNENGTYTVDGFSGDTEVLEIPAYIDGIEVTEISSWFNIYSPTNVTKIVVPETISKLHVNAFMEWSIECIDVNDDNPYFCDIDGVLYDKDVKTLIKYPSAKPGAVFNMPDTVTILGDYGMYSADVSQITLSEKLQVIGRSALYSCRSLNDITLPDTLTEIGERAFGYCVELETITLPDSLKKICDSAFESCDNLAEITIPDSVETVGDFAFGWCDTLRKIHIGSGVTSWGGYKGTDDYYYSDILYSTYPAEITVSPKNKILSAENNVLYNKEKTILFKYSAKKTDTVFAIPDGVQELWGRAFEYAENLTKVTIPESVEKIGGQCFRFCKNIKEIRIPDSVTEVENSAFRDCSSLETIYIGKNVALFNSEMLSGCTSLKNIKVSEGNPNYSSVNGVLFNKDKTKLIQYPSGVSMKGYVIPSTVKEVSSVAFDDCEGFYDEVSLNNIVYVGDCLLYYRVPYGEKREYISIKKGTRMIGSFAFEYNSKIRGISLPDEIRIISAEAFSGCDSLQTIYIPAGIKYIGSYAFSSSYELTDIYYGGTETQWNKIENIENVGLSENVTIHYESSGNEYVNPVLPEDDYINTYVDEESGISVSTDTEATLFTENVMTQEIVDMVAELLPKAKVESVYEINLQSEGEEIQPVDSVLVKIPTKNRFARVYRMEEDGTLTDMNAKYENGYLCFYTDHFSYYALGMKKAENYEVGDVDMDEKINIKDATAVQKHLADVTEYQQDVIDLLMDFDQNGTVNIKDATAIQKKVAGLI